jgi:hypothetical protein
MRKIHAEDCYLVHRMLFEYVKNREYIFDHRSNSKTRFMININRKRVLLRFIEKTSSFPRARARVIIIDPF